MQNDVRFKGEHHKRQSKRKRLSTVDPKWLTETIGAIYDCALQPENWQATIAEISLKLGFANAVLGIVRLGPGRSNVLVNSGVDLEFDALSSLYVAHSIEMWGGQSMVERWPLEEPAIASEIIPIERKQRNQYYVDLLEPRGLTDSAVVILSREAQMFCYLGLNRHVSVGDVTSEVVEILRLLAPHLRRAVTISELFDLKKVESTTFGSVLDAMSCGVLLVDESLHVVHANHAGSAMISSGGALATNQGELVLMDRNADTALRKAVEVAATDEGMMARRGIGIPVQRPDGPVMLMHVLPLRRGVIRTGLVQRATAAIFIVDSADKARLPVDALAMMFDFTPAESLVFMSLAQGKSLEKTAEALGVAKSTSRTHLLRIFEKTGCKRQAELVALAARHSLSI